MKPIYEPKGAAKEYGDYAINIYKGCPHRCYYCFAPGVLHRQREAFHGNCEPRDGIVEAVAKQIKQEHITGKTIHLCFTCDPYPMGCDSTPTREIIKLLKESGNHVQILTKGNATRDFDLLDDQDWFGVSISGADEKQEPNCLPCAGRVTELQSAAIRGIKTWVSFEPVVNEERVLQLIESLEPFADKVKIGKLNYHPSDINWAEFGRKVEALCQELGLDYTIKDSLRKCMESTK